MTYISVTEYAQMQKCTRQNILKKLNRKTLKGKKVGKTWIINVKNGKI